MRSDSGVCSVIAQLPKSFDQNYQWQLANKLSRQEQIKLNALQSSSRRSQFIFARYLVKQLLNSCLGYDLPLLMGTNGKPYVSEQAIDISISHSHKMVAVVIGKGVKVGIDIERKKPRRFKALYKNTFNTAEAARLDSISKKGLSSEFYRLWTAKEATAKLTQTTLMTSLKQFLVEGCFVNHLAGELKKTDVLIASLNDRDYFLSIAYEGITNKVDRVNLFKFLDDEYIEIIPSNPLSVYTCA